METDATMTERIQMIAAYYQKQTLNMVNKKKQAVWVETEVEPEMS